MGRAPAVADIANATPSLLKFVDIGRARRPSGGLTGGVGLRSRTTDDEGRSGARMGALPQHPETDFTDTPGPFWGFLFGTNDE